MTDRVYKQNRGNNKRKEKTDRRREVLGVCSQVVFYVSGISQS
jgi:hypothetical protein